jgi:hypothetical protein
MLDTFPGLFVFLRQRNRPALGYALPASKRIVDFTRDSSAIGGKPSWPPMVFVVPSSRGTDTRRRPVTALSTSSALRAPATPSLWWAAPSRHWRSLQRLSVTKPQTDGWRGQKLPPLPTLAWFGRAHVHHSGQLPTGEHSAVALACESRISSLIRTSEVAPRPPSF